MAYKDFMNKIRYWDHMSAKWLMRHFYFTFFQIILVIVFLFWFANTLGVIDVSHISEPTNSERISVMQTVNTSIIALLLLLNSFWLLFVFNAMQRIMTLLKDLSYTMSKIRSRQN